MFRILILVSLALYSTGCASTDIRDFEKIQVGMDKDDVLKIMGSPNKSERWKGMDRWTYVLWNDNQDGRREVHFNEGRATYVGDMVKPEISAEEQDRLNAESNAALERQIAEQKKQNQSEYKKYEDAANGNEEVRTVPSFIPVQ
jgi:outer membrane protein assembly factor BamE